MFSLLPRENVFFDLFDKSAQNVHEGAKAFADLVANFSDVQAKARRIKDIEHAGDELTHEIVRKLNETFITPLDREDIHNIASRLDDILDFIDTAVSRIVMYKVGAPAVDVQEMGKVLVAATSDIIAAMKDLRDLKNKDKVLARCKDIKTHETTGDKHAHHALAQLFEHTSNPVDIIKWKDILESVETAIDKCEDVANVVEGVVLKNA